MPQAIIDSETGSFRDRSDVEEQRLSADRTTACLGRTKTIWLEKLHLPLLHHSFKDVRFVVEVIAIHPMGEHVMK